MLSGQKSSSQTYWPRLCPLPFKLKRKMMNIQSSGILSVELFAWEWWSAWKRKSAPGAVISLTSLFKANTVVHTFLTPLGTHCGKSRVVVYGEASLVSRADVFHQSAIYHAALAKLLCCSDVHFKAWCIAGCVELASRLLKHSARRRELESGVLCKVWMYMGDRFKGDMGYLNSNTANAKKIPTDKRKS